MHWTSALAIDSVVIDVFRNYFNVITAILQNGRNNLPQEGSRVFVSKRYRNNVDNLSLLVLGIFMYIM